jgi:hypothetical protein
MTLIVCFCFGALLAGLDGLRLTAFAQTSRLIPARVNKLAGFGVNQSRGFPSQFAFDQCGALANRISLLHKPFVSFGHISLRRSSGPRNSDCGSIIGLRVDDDAESASISRRRDKFHKVWLRRSDSNRRPGDYEPPALPGCATPQNHDSPIERRCQSQRAGTPGQHETQYAQRIAV